MRGLPSTTLTALLLTACTGNLVQKEYAPRDPQTDPDQPKPPCVVSTELRPSSIQRLTQSQFASNVQSLLTLSIDAAGLPADVKEGLFPSNGSTSVTADIAERYLTVAEAVADQVEAHAMDYAPCTGTDQQACARAFFQRFGRLAFRRTLEGADLQRYLALYDLERTEAGYAGGIRAMVEAALQSPKFLYRIEPIPAGTTPDDVDEYAIDSIALANRLSFLVWNMGPDDELLSQAESGALAGEAITEQVQRMLALEATKHTTAVFADAWAGLDDLAAAANSSDRLGPLPPEVIAAMQRETEGFIDGVLRSPDGTFAELLTAADTRPEALLTTKIYGDAGQRSGLLTLASVLFTKAHSDQTSPVLRGKWLRENVLCSGVPPPPNDFVPTVSAPSPNLTTRERSMEHRDNPQCAGCHALLDDTGFGFEAYDQYGRFRSSEAGKAIDSTGKLVGTDVDGEFNGALELGLKLSTSKQATQCFGKHWFRYAFGREASTADTCLVEKMSQKMEAGAGGYAALVTTLATSDIFGRRKTP